MKIAITFKQQNPNFDKQYAKDYHFGKESDGNWKDLWSREYIVKDVDKVTVIEKGKLEVPCLVKDVKQTFLLPDMKIFEFHGVNFIATFAISMELIKNIQKTYIEKYDISRYYIYINPNKKYCMLGEHIYLTEEDYPELLK